MGHPRLCLPQHRASPVQFFLAYCVTGCQLGGYPAGRDWWGGDRNVGRVLPRIDIDANVWGESSIMTGVYECWCCDDPSFIVLTETKFSFCFVYFAHWMGSV